MHEAGAIELGGDSFTAYPPVHRNRTNRADAKKSTAGRKAPRLSPGGIHVLSPTVAGRHIVCPLGRVTSVFEGQASRVPFAGRSRQQTTMHEHDTTAAERVRRRTSKYSLRYPGGVSGCARFSRRRLAYPGYPGNLHLHAGTGDTRARERPHAPLIFLDTLDIDYSNTRKRGGAK